MTMVKDYQGDAFPTFQALHDAIQLDRAELGEKLSSQGKGSVENALTLLIESQIQQTNQLMRAIGQLESRLIALQEAAGIEDFHYPVIDFIPTDFQKPEQE